MFRVLLFVTLSLLVIAFVLPVSSVSAADDHDLIISNSWVRATGGAGERDDMTQGDQDSAGEYGPTAAYMELANQTDMALRLVAASSPAAGVVEIHETVIENDVMRMSPADGLDISAGGVVIMAPGGLHLMLLDLERDLVVGEAISLSLFFETVAEGDTESLEVVIGVPVLEEAPQNPPEIVVADVWARPTAMTAMHDDQDVEPDMIPPSAAYMTITNTGDEDRTIVGASSDLAGVVELHNTLMEDGVMRMFELEDGIALLAGETVELRPRALHVMLMQLTRDLLPGDALFLALELDNGEVLTLGVPVRDEMDMMPDAMSG